MQFKSPFKADLANQYISIGLVSFQRNKLFKYSVQSVFDLFCLSFLPDQLHAEIRYFLFSVQTPSFPQVNCFEASTGRWGWKMHFFLMSRSILLAISLEFWSSTSLFICYFLNSFRNYVGKRGDIYWPFQGLQETS